MNFHFSPVPVVDCSALDCSGGEAWGTSSGTTIASESLPRESETGSLTTPRSSAISEHSSIKGTPDNIGAWLTSLPRDSRANRSRRPGGNDPKKTNGINGQTPFAYCERSDRGGFSVKTSRGFLPGLTDISDEFSETWPKSGLMCDGECFRLPDVERRTDAKGYGLLATPTAKGNQLAPSMIAKHPGCRRMLPDAVGGLLNPEFGEWLMGWPIGHTDAEQSATDKFRQWWLAHGGS